MNGEPIQEALMPRFVGVVAMLFVVELTGLVVVGCNSSDVVGVPGIEYSASARAANESYVEGGDVLVGPIYHLTTTATLKNVSDGPVKLQYGALRPAHGAI